MRYPRFLMEFASKEWEEERLKWILAIAEMFYYF